MLTTAEHHLGTLRNREDANYWRANASLGLARVRNGDAGGWRQLTDALVAFEARGTPERMAYAEAMAAAADAALRPGDSADAQARAAQARAPMPARLAPEDPRLLALLPKDP